MSFYRKYRPAVLSEIDNDMVRQQLTSFLSKDKKDLPHAYLFTGPKGAGKTTAARLVAKIFNCEKPDKSGSPCGTCEACKMIAQARHLDVLELDAASNRGIDEIRALRDTIALPPSFAPPPMSKRSPRPSFRAASMYRLAGLTKKHFSLHSNVSSKTKKFLLMTTH
ncbi:MAG: polymerase III, subunit gamma/tau protein [Candidatus Gottesmanbacteria bacterium GW2011_GWA1_47_8]|uniref:Polymerase III, subunit gamma/tau protein n=1 Tax=Candidatus Gottesmanbacteria bacterium GW2011_GWA1_47_8 TaxID=1618438 RepID=A0A0G1TGQ2_9BACT|nr:MAG: polymerase III, subunit gamma/tau protein [Candidatus Gottesmanbacteria bacterium GW2011_GWA1_47_8]